MEEDEKKEEDDKPRLSPLEEPAPPPTSDPYETPDAEREHEIEL